MSSKNIPAIVATSTSSLDYFDIRDLPIYIIRTYMKVGDDRIIDGLTTRADALYQRLKENPQYVPETFPPVASEVLNLLNKVKAEGYKDILVLSVSQKISEAYKIICEMAKKVEGANIVIYDTGTCSVPEGLFGYKAAQMAKKGASVEEIIKVLDKMKPDTEMMFCVNNLKYLCHHGHLTVSKKVLASIFQLKPILSFKNGEFSLLETVYKTENAIKRLAEMAALRIKNPNLLPMGLFMANQNLYSDFTALLPEALKFEYPLTPVVGAHVGIDGVGVAFTSRFDKWD